MTRAPTRFSLKIQEFVTVKALIGDGIMRMITKQVVRQKHLTQNFYCATGRLNFPA